MSDDTRSKASPDRVAQALQAITQLREETEVLARAYGVADVPAAKATEPPEVPPAEEAPAEAAEETVASPEVAEETVAEPAAPVAPRTGTNRYDAALEVIHTEGVAGLRALAGRGFRAGSSFLQVWREETQDVLAQWRSRAGGEVDQVVTGAEESVDAAAAGLETARARLTDLGS